MFKKPTIRARRRLQREQQQRYTFHDNLSAYEQARHAFTRGAASDEAEAVAMGASVPVETGGPDLDRLEEMEADIAHLQEALVMLATQQTQDGEGDMTTATGAESWVGKHRTGYSINDETTVGSLAQPLDDPRIAERERRFQPNAAGTIRGRESITAKTHDPGEVWGSHGKHPNAPMSKDDAARAARYRQERLQTNRAIDAVRAKNEAHYGLKK